MQFVTAEMVHELLPWDGLMDALWQAHQGPMPEVDVLVQSDPQGGGNQFISLPGWLPGGPIAVKLVGVFPENERLTPPQPNVQGLVALFNGETGAPLLVADGAAMTARKTAADSALGARILARPDVEHLLIVGAGALAPWFARAHLAARPGLRRISIWNRTRTKAETVAAGLVAEGHDAAVVDDLDAAVSKADLISCITMSDQVLVKGALLKSGSHLDLVGAYLPSLRETDDEALGRGRIFVDTRNNIDNTGDLAQGFQSGVITPSAIVADLYDLAQGRDPGRQSPDEITIFKNIGGAHLDMFTASALQAAMGQGA